MYRLNFHDQNSACSQFMAPTADYSLKTPVLAAGAKLPQFFDSFGSSPSRFEHQLHKVLQDIKAREQAVNTKAKNPQLKADARHNLTAELQTIQRSQKLINMLVDNMQKINHTIAANFR